MKFEDERDVDVVSRAQPCEFASDAGTVREESCRFEHRPKFTAHASNPADHAKLAHVGLHALDVVVLEKFLDLRHGPAGCQPRVLVDEESAVLPLMLIDLSAEAHVPLGLLHPELEFLHPEFVVAIHVFVEFL